MQENIVLIGFMGCGKTTVGKALAEELGYSFLDTDQYIETMEQCSISDIFQEHGEEYFRSLETKSIRQLQSEVVKSVISTGGGLPLREENAAILKKMGFVIYLRVRPDTIENRLENDTKRPLLQGKDARKKIEGLLEYREPIYEYGAHMILDVDESTVSDIVEEIKRNYSIILKKEIGTEESMDCFLNGKEE